MHGPNDAEAPSSGTTREALPLGAELATHPTHLDATDPVNMDEELARELELLTRSATSSTGDEIAPEAAEKCRDVDRALAAPEREEHVSARGVRLRAHTAGEDRWPASRVESSMGAHDYAMLAETLREGGNPLVGEAHDLSLATHPAAFGAVVDLTARTASLVGPPVTPQDAQERRARRRPAPLSPATGPAEPAQPTEVEEEREGGRTVRRRPPRSPAPAPEPVAVPGAGAAEAGGQGRRLRLTRGGSSTTVGGGDGGPPPSRRLCLTRPAAATTTEPAATTATTTTTTTTSTPTAPLDVLPRGQRPPPISPPSQASDGAAGGGASLSPLSARRPSSIASAVAAFAPHRTRTPTPTPTPTGLYSLADATPHRVHGATRVPLPLTPPTVDFTLVTRWLEDGYELTRKISEGTYGEVYVGRAKGTGDVVALKRLKVLRGLDGFPITSLREVIALHHTSRQRQRLVEQQQQQQQQQGGERSAGVAGAVAGDPLEEVVDLRDVLLSREPTHDIFLIFNYASSSVAGLLSRRFPFTLPDVAYLFRKIVLGVRKLHDMGIIHRDIKTDNVLVCRDGGVQLADFGLCAFEGAGARALTPSMVNLSYRPPEMLLGGTRYDTKVDIWSIGCFLAQVFLLHPPFYRRRSAEEAGRAAREHRSSETELEQLALIAEVLGPITATPPDAFPADTCAHLDDLRRLQEAVMAAERGRDGSAAPQDSAPGAAPGRARGGLARVRALFYPSFLHSQFHGFRRWFIAEMENRRTQYALHGGGGGGRPPLLLPSPACLDVLESIFRYDPRQRPTAAQLLREPFFQLLDGDPAAACGALLAAPGVTAEEALAARERAARARFAQALVSFPDSHLQPTPKQ